MALAVFPAATLPNAVAKTVPQTIPSAASRGGKGDATQDAAATDGKFEDSVSCYLHADALNAGIILTELRSPLGYFYQFSLNSLPLYHSSSGSSKSLDKSR